MSKLDQAAFPMPISGETDAGNYTADGLAGLTKLEYAAVHIAAGMYANGPLIDGAALMGPCAEAVIATAAVQQARALFAELEKEQ